MHPIMDGQSSVVWQRVSYPRCWNCRLTKRGDQCSVVVALLLLAFADSENLGEISANIGEELCTQINLSLEEAEQWILDVFSCTS